jgi:hypothetical protein
LFASAEEWNLIRPDLALVGIDESARHANVLRISGREWFQAQYRTAGGPARYEVGVVCDDNDPGVNIRNMATFTGRLGGSHVGLREYGKVVRYLTVSVPVPAEGSRSTPAREAAMALTAIIKHWGA